MNFKEKLIFISRKVSNLEAHLSPLFQSKFEQREKKTKFTDKSLLNEEVYQIKIYLDIEA